MGRRLPGPGLLPRLPRLRVGRLPRGLRVRLRLSRLGVGLTGLGVRLSGRWVRLAGLWLLWLLRIRARPAGSRLLRPGVRLRLSRLGEGLTGHGLTGHGLT
ncbi:hypothetical protein, partial [Streptomyces sp. SID5643]|uniref:hypothetical protein n=1 Tax=Streptomyces sp. SID5643 TaxID=2690307 RepID=UPI0013717B88